MSDETLFSSLHKHAVQLSYKTNDFIGGDFSHPSARALQNEVRQLQEDFEVRKRPRSIEDRIKTIQNLLRQSQGITSSYMTYGEFDYLYDSLEDMRQSLRKLSNY